MNEHLWFLAAWIGGLVGGISIGWTACAWTIRSRAHRAARRLMEQCAVMFIRPSDVNQKTTLDVAPDIYPQQQDNNQHLNQ